jgi:Spy/CpxP family protein refolding chaperone
MSGAKTTTVAILVLALTFIAGMAVGVLASHLMILHGGHGAALFPTSAMVNRLDRRLDLTDPQRARVQEIITRHHARIGSIWSAVNPRVRGEIEQANAEISQVLTPEQRVKFDRIKLHLAGRQ